MKRIVLCALASILLSACASSGLITPTQMPPAEPITVPQESPSATAGSPEQPVNSENQPNNTATPDIYAPAEGDDALLRSPVEIESVDVLVLESFPLQYRLALKGSLPAPCNRLRVVITPPNTENVIVVDAYSLSSPDLACAMVMTPFEANLSLNGFAPGMYKILVNGKASAELVVQ